MVRYGLAMRVKNIARTGWMMRGIPPSDSETVGSHSFEVAFLSMLIADRLTSIGVTVDVSKILRLALLHDLTESVIGDIVRA
ncbi:MAG: HD domain-containing protein, partial [Sulfolobales archaeon]